MAQISSQMPNYIGRLRKSQPEEKNPFSMSKPIKCVRPLQQGRLFYMQTNHNSKKYAIRGS